jgi:hypothetical protein
MSIHRYIVDQKRSLGGSKFWLLVLDDCMDHAWSHFLKHKDDQVDLLIEEIKDLKVKEGKVMKFIQCNNAGEQFKYMSSNSPQFNGRVKR